MRMREKLPAAIKNGPIDWKVLQRLSMSGQSLKPIDFTDFLIECKALTEAQLLDVLADHWQTRDELAECIVRRGYLPKSEVERLLKNFENLQVVYV